MNILFIDSAHPLLKIELEKSNFICTEDFTSSKEEIEKKISSYTGVIIRSRFSIDQKFIDAFSQVNIKRGVGIPLFIARIGAGMEHIDVPYAKIKGVVCLASNEGNSNAVAEHSLGMLLCLLNNITNANTEVKAGKWRREFNRGTELEGKTIGIYGYGNTGTAFAKILRGFNVKLLVYDKYKKDFTSEFVIETSAQEIFSQADVLSLHLPLNAETKYLVNNTFINKFKKNIYLINSSRGSIVKTNDLVENMKKGKILGACLDVLEYEETSFELLQDKAGLEKLETLQYLYDSKKVILTPHIAGWSFESSEKMAVIILKKIMTLIAK